MSKFQIFGPSKPDFVRLEIEETPTGLSNKISNPSGDLGAFGWNTPVAGSTLVATNSPTHPKAHGVVNGSTLIYTSSGVVAQYVTSSMFPVTPGQSIAASWRAPYAGTHYRQKIEFFDSARALLSSSTQTGYLAGAATTAYAAPFTIPASTVYARIRFDFYGSNAGAIPAAGQDLLFKEVTVATAATSAALGSLRKNRMPNPSFETGLTGWSVTQPAGQNYATLSQSATFADSGTSAAKLVSNQAFTVGIGHTGRIAVTAGQEYVITAKFRAGATPRSCNVSAAYFTTAGGSIGTNGGQSPSVVEVAGGWVTATLTTTVPAGYPFLEVRFTIDCQTVGEAHYIDSVRVGLSSEDTAYFDGATPDTVGADYSWLGAAHASESQVITSTLDYIPPVTYRNILGSAGDIKVVRNGLDVGTLNATIVDAAIDPATSALIAPGKRIRLLAMDAASGTWAPLFTGKVLNPKVTYDEKALASGDTSPKTATIALTASDNTTPLAGTAQINGVGTIAELPYLLEGSDVPWLCNGSGNQVATATVVSTNENASLLDQVAITRDSNGGYAWVNAAGVLVANTAANMGAAVATIDETYYSDLDVDYNTDDCINEVTVKWLRYNSKLAQTEEIAYGPYRDATSVAKYGTHSAEFTLQGATEDPVAIAAFASNVLTKNGTPVVRMNSVTIPILTASDLVRAKAFLDLYDKVNRKSTVKGFDDFAYINGIVHEIKSDKWIMTVAFSETSSVASPQVTPSPAPADALGGWIDLPYASGFTAGTPGQLAYRVVGGVVYIRGGATKSSDYAGGTQVAVNSTALPINLRPSATIRNGTYGTGSRSAVCEVRTDGLIYLTAASGVTGVSWVAADLSYPVG